MVALTNQAIDGALLSFPPVVHVEVRETGLLGKLVGGLGQRGFKRQVDEVGLLQADAVRANRIADESRVAWVDVEVVHSFFDELVLGFLQRDDAVVEDLVEAGLANLVLLHFVVTDGDCDEHETIVGAVEHFHGVAEELGLAEVWCAADALEDRTNVLAIFGRNGQQVFAGEQFVGLDQGFGEALTFEAAVRHAAMVDLGQRVACNFLADADVTHEGGEFLGSFVEVGLADDESAVHVDEQSCDLAIGSAEIAVADVAV